jgi:putative heme-binding domain-containing protein
MELEFTVQRDKLGLFGSRPQHDTFGVTDAMLVAPGEPSRSILLERLSRRGRGQMPPLVTAEVDHKAVQLMRDWISQMKAVNTFVRAWTMDDLVPHLDSVGANRSFTQGKLAFDKVGCAQCHRFFGEGGTVGPDLTGIGRRQTKREILESIIEPSKVVTDEYASYLFATEGGKVVTGRIEHDDGEKVTIRTGSGADDVIRLAKSDIVERRKSNVSNMPAGTVHVLEREQILDLMAYLLSDGDSDKPAFK